MLTIRETLDEFRKSEAYDHLFNNLRGKYLKEFENSTMEDYAVRQQAFIKLNALREIQREIDRFLNDLRIDRKRKLTEE